MGMFRSRVIRWAAVPLFLAAIIMSGAGCGSINQAPIINGLNVSEDTVAPGAIVKLACNALDPEKRDLTYTWTASGGTITGESASATWTAPSAGGSYKLQSPQRTPAAARYPRAPMFMSRAAAALPIHPRSSRA